MIVLGIDPGATTGLAVLDTHERRVLWCGETDDVTWLRADYVLHGLEQRKVPVVAVEPPGVSRGWAAYAAVYERIQSYGKGANADFIDTAELGGYCRHALGAHPMTRPEAIRALGLSGSGIGKSAVWAEVVRILGSDRAGKLCPRRNRKDHRSHPLRSDVLSSLVRDPLVCPVCGGSGWEREPGPLAMFRGKVHAKDALALAVAWSLKEGLL